jgi:hypothetical protein
MKFLIPTDLPQRWNWLMQWFQSYKDVSFINNLSVWIWFWIIVKRYAFLFIICLRKANRSDSLTELYCLLELVGILFSSYKLVIIKNFHLDVSIIFSWWNKLDHIRVTTRNFQTNWLIGWKTKQYTLGLYNYEEG